jgi:uncharacterized membrane protein YhaH (DUF805 family)
MLAAVFSFRGRINRLSYFLGSLGLGLAVIVVAVVVVLATVGAGGIEALKADPLRVLPAVLLLLLLLLPAFWIGFSLQARRIRDMGFNPALVIPGMIFYVAVDHALAAAMSGGAAVSASGHTLIYPFVSLAYSGALLFWPGKPSDAQAPTSWADNVKLPDPPATPRRSPAPTRAPEPAPAPMFLAPVQARPAGPAPFGRRGL